MRESRLQEEDGFSGGKPDRLQNILARAGVASRRGAAALIAKSIKKYEVIAYPELGPEALAALTVEDFPAIVVIDTEGNNFYEIGQKPYREI